MKSPTDPHVQFAVNRLATDCDTMKQLLLGLLDSKGRVADEVHAIRKLGKSLRGGFSLFRLEKSACLEIQSIGRLLSGPRDAVSRLSTWQKLGWDSDPFVAAAVFGLLEQQTHSAARRPPPETIAWCGDRVDAAMAILNDLPQEDLAKKLNRGLRKIERNAIASCQRLSQRDPAEFHEARKALKAWLGAASFLPEQKPGLDPMIAELAELLGDENDLTTLSAWLKGHGFTSTFAPDLWKTLKARRRKLQRKVIRQAKALPGKRKR